ncbi:MAG: adenylate/guanylate cyclase domain-containing protein [Proteobacteria bacterium]|nr:adenylate/guanylate cyclase domain-containing protein [Pseudomonadota bacterium]
MEAASFSENTAPADKEQSIREIEAWLTQALLGEIQFGKLFSEFSKRIDETLFPVLRSHVTMRQIHPYIDHTDLTWYRGGIINTNSQPRPDRDRLIWTQSPLFHMVENFIPEARYDLTDPEVVGLFPIFTDFQEMGITDYIAFLIPFGDIEVATKRSDGVVTSWATDREGGFTEAELDILRRLVSLFSVGSRIHKLDTTLDDSLAAYLGPIAGQQVLDGKNQRGDGDVIQAVIWICDLRGSSELADTLAMPEYLALLNQFFESMANAVMAENGEILKFMGDGFLAIFPTSHGEGLADAANRALRAAINGDQALSSLASDAKNLKYGIGIHHGDVMFGNIGAQERLDFSVIGPAVNMTSRIQDLTKALGVSLLVSTDIADKIDTPWRRFENQSVPGLQAPIDVLTPAGS